LKVDAAGEIQAIVAHRFNGLANIVRQQFAGVFLLAERNSLNRNARFVERKQYADTDVGVAAGVEDRRAKDDSRVVMGAHGSHYWIQPAAGGGVAAAPRVKSKSTSLTLREIVSGSVSFQEPSAWIIEK